MFTSELQNTYELGYCLLAWLCIPKIISKKSRSKVSHWSKKKKYIFRKSKCPKNSPESLVKWWARSLVFFFFLSFLNCRVLGSFFGVPCWCLVMWTLVHWWVPHSFSEDFRSGNWITSLYSWKRCCEVSKNKAWQGFKKMWMGLKGVGGKDRRYSKFAWRALKC